MLAQETRNRKKRVAKSQAGPLNCGLPIMKAWPTNPRGSRSNQSKDKETLHKSVNSLNAYKQKILKSINRSNNSEFDENGNKRSDDANFKQESDDRGRSRESNPRYAKKSWQDLREELVSS